MSQILLLALAASIPLALLAFAAAWVIEAMGGDVKLRLCAWTAALLLPVLPAPAMLAIHALDIPSPFTALLQAAPDNEPVVALVEPPAVAAPEPAPAPKPPRIPLVPLALGLIGAGAAFRLGQLALGLRRVARLKAASEPIADPDMAERLGRGVRLADTETPVLAGLIRPTILLPRRLLGGLSADQASLVCAHERAHLAAGDHLSHLMEETMVRIFWFNPVMAAARERLAAAREEACDARALTGCDAGRRREYARTLIAALKLAGRAEPVAAFTGFRRRGAERRLRAILKPTGPGSWRALVVAILAGLGLVLAAGSISLAAAADAAPPAPQAPAAPPAAHHGISMIVTEDDAPDPRHKLHRHVRMFDGGHWVVGDWDKLTPEQRAKVDAAMKKAREAEMKAIPVSRAAAAESRAAIAESRAAMVEANRKVADADRQAAEAGREAQRASREIFRMSAEMPDGRQVLEWRGMTPEQRAKVRASVEEAMKHAEFALSGPDDGRVPMRCKIGPDGKPSDCVPFSHPVNFTLSRDPPPAPPPPAPPAPPSPPAVG